MYNKKKEASKTRKKLPQTISLIKTVIASTYCLKQVDALKVWHFNVDDLSTVNIGSLIPVTLLIFSSGDDELLEFMSFLRFPLSQKLHY